jgi:UDP-N-acetylmuramyl pentapeptide phosphotransferase/UDP-N-acetylglucosamine-1-phosphate transferase
MTAILFFIFSFVVAYFFIPQIIAFANKKNLVDVPDHRKAPYLKLVLFNYLPVSTFVGAYTFNFT